MFSLGTISKMNTLKAVAWSRRVARALNNPGGHAKDAEKGRAASHRIPMKLGSVDNVRLSRISSVAH